MIKRYIKQTWAMLRQHKLFGALYIIGTAIPIALTMIVITFQYIRVGSIYPEEHRDEVWITNRAYTQSGMRWINLWVVKEWFYPMKGIQAATAFRNDTEAQVLLPDSKASMQVLSKLTDPGFFKVFDFDFLAGKSFTEADLANGNFRAVITASLSRRLFGTEQAVGKTFAMNQIRFTVAGVVRDVSALTPLTCAQVYVPYSCFPEDGNAMRRDNVMGDYTVCMRIPSGNGAAVQANVEERNRLFQQMHQIKAPNYSYVQPPCPLWKYNVNNQSMDQDDNVSKALRLFGGLVLVFLLVPALNLSGMISSRMEGRLPEMGIYKAFGATRRYLLGQVLGENLVLTLLGGLVGLLLAWSVLVWGRSWIYSFIFPDVYLLNGPDVLVTVEMLFSPWVFLSAFLICVVLNVASALIPAWNSLRSEIVYSLNQKK
ncbi:ABC transporter permease [Bacteroides sp. OF04-15BH]|uniref:ABC transporter permease n=1 Tax=Bacteroides sp. OF04-15BH TaxID=2292281 RepID=UPI000E4C9B45|nr:ABC transporter permease [Bacteroides sp. OF04-15BH]RHP67366.1 ABC transporter permease [Bacteroides sp. OF04-15BH]